MGWPGLVAAHSGQRKCSTDRQRRLTPFFFNSETIPVHELNTTDTAAFLWLNNYNQKNCPSDSTLDQNSISISLKTDQGKY
jgi:hypothetical protein